MSSSSHHTHFACIISSHVMTRTHARTHVLTRGSTCPSLCVSDCAAASTGRLLIVTGTRVVSEARNTDIAVANTAVILHAQADRKTKSVAVCNQPPCYGNPRVWHESASWPTVPSPTQTGVHRWTNNARCFKQPSTPSSG